jgi:hypothetical protein
MTCENCGTSADVRPYPDPEIDETVALCPACASDLESEDDVTAGLVSADEDPDSEFTDACTTAADYMRADEGF